MPSTIIVAFSDAPTAAQAATGLEVRMNEGVRDVKFQDGGGVSFPTVTGIGTSRVRFSGAPAGNTKYQFSTVGNGPKVVSAHWTKGIARVKVAKHVP